MIETPKDFETWLKAQSPEVFLIVATRAAIRTFPVLTIPRSWYGPPSGRWIPRALRVARVLLTLSVAVKFPTQQFGGKAVEAISQLSGDISLARANSGHASKGAYQVETNPTNRSDPEAAKDIREWGNTASLATLSTEAVYYVAYAYADSVGAARMASTVPPMFEEFDASFLEAVQTDADSSSDSLFGTPLWPGMIEPEWLQDIAPHADRIIENEDEWSFWRDWYQGILDGKPLDWELQRRVALIPDEDWEKGPEHIAEKIEEIRARFELEKRIEALEAEKQVWEEQVRLGIGGNNPPEPIEEARIIQEIIWAPIEELKAEAQSDAPDKSRVQAAISKLAGVLIIVGKWSLGKFDSAADAFVKSFGGGLGGYCAGWIATNGDKIAEIIKAAQALLATMT